MTDTQSKPRLEVTIHDQGEDTQQRSFPLGCDDTPQRGAIEQQAGYVVTADLIPDNIDDLRQKAHLFGYVVKTTTEAIE